MKKTMLQRILRWFSIKILEKYKPEIIGITGSIGKTSAKEAVNAVLSSKFNVRINIKNYNNEIGLPLTIIGMESGGRSKMKWLLVFFKALKLIIFKDNDYPKILILEMGSDRVGDIKYLTDLANCKIGIVTYVGTSHIEYFKTREKIAEEKSVIVSHIKNGWAVLNVDNDYVEKMQGKVTCQLITYAIDNVSANIKASNIEMQKKEDGEISGLCFDLNYENNVEKVVLSNIMGKHLVYAVLAASAVGIIYGLSLKEISEALKGLKSSKGRMSLIQGIKGTFIIDDTYNASPDSVKAALLTFTKIETDKNKFVVLGDMLELGAHTEESHKNIGREMVITQAQALITVGERAKDVANGAREAGFANDSIFCFAKPEEAGLFLQERIKKGDWILIKGSRGMKMEKIVKEIMAEPQREKELLV